MEQEKVKVKPLSFVNLNKSKHKSIINNIDNISVLFEREIQISISKCKKRLTLTLSKELDKSIEPISITNNNIIGIDIGGSIENTLVNSNGEIVSFTHLDNLIKKLDVNLVEMCFLMNIKILDGAKKLKEVAPVYSVLEI